MDYEEAFAAYRKASEHGRTFAEYYEKQAKALEQWAKRLRNEADSWDLSGEWRTYLSLLYPISNLIHQKI